MALRRCAWRFTRPWTPSRTRPFCAVSKAKMFQAWGTDLPINHSNPLERIRNLPYRMDLVADMPVDSPGNLPGHTMRHKAKLSVTLGELDAHMTLLEREVFLEMVGKRFSHKYRKVRFVSRQLTTEHGNTHRVLDMFEACMRESKRLAASFDGLDLAAQEKDNAKSPAEQSSQN
mmetsp:Transcript_6739/g.7518  ORF Transcript_6739/g.7518 Transcript_6739/m.7518 type:complete len:174 (-) Transcript_6739:92-613(-)|eukprot:CAMPEP_0205829494 /NCGR_PEP_ID=MMETSP0206-20130828/38302_1 /ASSEMBLY_ACC=CAM_ASM_000279 /TAXON_ID=36767 /ORGANISM="Euplotes focardii, Strain TN1" /LENGTH=173 /DNA_ID=CAMNT_0053132269 /DNA_START=59 /DNA_END=580 /DNA_ORIENTATION=+